MTELPFRSGARLCGYVRDSGGRTQELSTDQQEQKLAEFCKDNDLLLTRLFCDEAQSGKKMSVANRVGRLQFLAMVDYLEGGAPETGVLFWSYARFSRDYDDTQYYLARLRRAGKTIHSLSDSVPDSLDGRMLESMIAWKNAKYRQDLARDISRGLAFMVHSRRVWSGGHPPIGYRLEPVETGHHRDGRPRRNSCLVVDPLVAPQVRQAFELRARGATLGEIIQDCPLLSRDHTVIAYMLRNPTYIGTGIFNGQEITAYCEPLIDLDTWQAVQRVNQERSTARGPQHPRSVRSRYLLSGLLICRICGRPMFGQSFKHSRTRVRYDYYRCQFAAQNKCSARMIPKMKLESQVIDRLIESVLQPYILKDLIAEQQRSQAATNQRQGPRLAEVQAELGTLQIHLDRLVTAIAEYGHSRTLLVELAALEEQQRQALRRQSEIEIQVDKFELPDPEQLSRQLIDALRGMDVQAQKSALQSIVFDIDIERLSDRTIQGQIRYRLPRSELIGFVEL